MRSLFPNVLYDKDAEVNVELGPLHTVFDDQGYAYTSLFVEGAVARSYCTNFCSALHQEVQGYVLVRPRS
ncbi:Nitrous-oxide reductase [bacterium HR08]|nr:Nitrous-oxide reductase [bacterium HR08]